MICMGEHIEEARFLEPVGIHESKVADQRFWITRRINDRGNVALINPLSKLCSNSAPRWVDDDGRGVMNPILCESSLLRIAGH